MSMQAEPLSLADKLALVAEAGIVERLDRIEATLVELGAKLDRFAPLADLFAEVGNGEKPLGLREVFAMLRGGG